MFDSKDGIINNKLEVTLYGHSNLISQFKDFLDFYRIRYNKEVIKNKRYSYLKLYNKEQVFKFHKLLYKDATVYLDRKKNFFNFEYFLEDIYSYRVK